MNDPFGQTVKPSLLCADTPLGQDWLPAAKQVQAVKEEEEADASRAKERQCGRELGRWITPFRYHHLTEQCNLSCVLCCAVLCCAAMTYVLCYVIQQPRHQSFA